MKKHIFWITAGWLLVLILSNMNVKAQECIADTSVATEACCNGFIRTDSTVATNLARPALRNRF